MPKKKEKKDTVLSRLIKELRGTYGNKAQVAEKLGISPQLLGQYEDGMQRPKMNFFIKWKEVFLDDLIELEKERNVSHETKNSTPAMKSTDSKETAIRGHVYTDLIERNSDYKLMPAMLLTDYSIIPKRILEGHEKEIARQDGLIAKYEGYINRLEKEIESLRSQLIPKDAQ